MNNRPRFLVCAYSPDDVGLVRPVLEDAGCVADITCRVDGYASTSFEPARHAGLIVLGDDQRHSDDNNFYGKEMFWVRAALEHGRGVLGICHGAQLLAHVCGGKLHHGARKADAGLTPLALTEEGEADPVVRHVVATPVAQWHYDTFEVPEGAVELALSTSKKRPHPDAFRIGSIVYGLQFHPEPTDEMLVRDGWVRPRPSGDVLASVEKAGRAVLAAWVGLVTSTHLLK